MLDFIGKLSYLDSVILRMKHYTTGPMYGTKGMTKDSSDEFSFQDYQKAMQQKINRILEVYKEHLSEKDYVKLNRNCRSRFHGGEDTILHRNLLFFLDEYGKKVSNELESIAREIQPPTEYSWLNQKNHWVRHIKKFSISNGKFRIDAVGYDREKEKNNETEGKIEPENVYWEPSNGLDFIIDENFQFSVLPPEIAKKEKEGNKYCIVYSDQKGNTRRGLLHDDIFSITEFNINWIAYIAVDSKEYYLMFQNKEHFGGFQASNDIVKYLLKESKKMNDAPKEQIKQLCSEFKTLYRKRRRHVISKFKPIMEKLSKSERKAFKEEFKEYQPPLALRILKGLIN